jgi:cytochrome c556
MALISAVALLGMPRAQAEDAKCGAKGQPSCPLQGWMEKNMQEPFEAKDLKKLAVSLEKAAGFAPDPSWNEGATSWSKIAKDAAAAAKAGKFDEVEKACKSCHKTWRKKYKQEHRTREIKG